MDEITLNRVRNAIADDLRQKGLMRPAGDPEALIDVSFGAKNASRRRGRNSRYRFKEGNLHIEFVDPSTDSLVSIGSAKAVLDADQTPDSAQKTVTAVVEHILKNYPG